MRAPYINRWIGTFNVLDEEGLSLIEHNADILLKETGMNFTGDPEILDIFRHAGADVQGERVRFEPGMCGTDGPDGNPAIVSSLACAAS